MVIPEGAAAALAALLLLAGCTSNPARPADSGRQRATAAVEVIRSTVKAGNPSAEAVARIEAACNELKILPHTQSVPVLVGSLQKGEDEFNRVIINLLDELDASDWVPVEFRARSLTIRFAVDLANKHATRAEQADAFIDQIEEACSSSPRQLAATWQGLLESGPITAESGAQPADITARVQGLAVLGLIRTMKPGDLDRLLDSVQKGRVTASAPILSQVLIHLSGNSLKHNLGAWLGGPPKSQAAAVLAVDLLRLNPPRGTEVAPERITGAKEWAAQLPDDAHWRRLVLAGLSKLSAEDQALHTAPPDSEEAARLNRARRCLDAPASANPLAWFTALPAENQSHGLERLAGIDLLIAPGR